MYHFYFCLKELTDFAVTKNKSKTSLNMAVLRWLDFTHHPGLQLSSPECDRSPSFSTKAKNEWSLYSHIYLRGVNMGSFNL